MKMRLAAVIMALLATLILSACGEEATNDAFEFDWDAENPFYGETLTVVSWWHPHAAQELASIYMRNNPGVTIEIEGFGTDVEAAREWLAMRLMAGEAPSLIVGQLVDHMNPHAARMFADWLPIMHSDTRFGEYSLDDILFLGGLDAFITENGQLHTFPAGIQYNYIVVNSTVPGLMEAVSAMNTISLTQMMELYEQFSPDSSMHMLGGFDVLFAVENFSQDFLDFDQERVDFANPEFINFITHAMRLTSPTQQFGNRFITPRGNRQAEIEASHQYLFMITYNLRFHHFSVFEEEAIFQSPLLFSNADGQVLVRPQTPFAIHASADPVQQALAWDFLLHTINPSPEAIFRVGYSHPIHRGWQQHHVTLILPGIAQDFYTSTRVETPWRRAGSWSDFSQTMLNEIHAAQQHPMADWRYAPEVVTDAISEILHQFHDGLITAEQASHDLQNRITLVIMEME